MGRQSKVGRKEGAYRKMTQNIKNKLRDAWVAQAVKCPPLGLGSGRDLMGCGIEPYIRLHAQGASESA